MSSTLLFLYSLEVEKSANANDRVSSSLQTNFSQQWLAITQNYFNNARMSKNMSQPYDGSHLI